MNLRILSVLLLVSALQSFTFAQSYIAGEKTKDSVRFYSRIEEISNKRKFTRLIYPLVFNPLPTELASKPKTSEYSPKPSNYAEFEGRIIRKIAIQTRDPFTTDIEDSVAQSKNFIRSAANNLHVKSIPIAIKNYLLFSRNERFDSLLVAESERLLRSQRFIREVAFHFETAGNDSVDVFIEEQDVWSIVPDASLGSDHLMIKLREQNFLGTGQQFEGTTNWKVNPFQNASSLGYEIPNIYNTYITSRLGYSRGFDQSFRKFASVERKFYSPFARWAGGFLVEQQYLKDSVVVPGIRTFYLPRKFNTTELWMAGAWQVFKGNSEIERISNLVLAGRWNKLSYIEKIPESTDTAGMFLSETDLLFSIGLNSRKYVQDRFLFKYGVTEYIPVGRVYSVIIGGRNRSGLYSQYSGVSIGFGDMFKYGYGSSTFELGFFRRGDQWEEGTFTATMSGFTNLLTYKSWKFRQFTSIVYTHGFNRASYEMLQFESDIGHSGFSDVLPGANRKLIVKLQSQSYAPWNLLGFRIGPFISGTVGFLGGSEGTYFNSTPYFHIGAGILIRNDYLNASTFQLSFSYFPILPGQRTNIFVPNTFSNTDFKLRDFDIGKPEVIPYR
ncbi:MAG: hypothetical protein IPH88_01605 [Bacteroidales bacterium]|nr:hypothetical protein [Bacteroidales bacterium]